MLTVKKSIQDRCENIIFIQNVVIGALITYILFDIGWILCSNIGQIITATLFYVGGITYVLNKISLFIVRR